MFWWKKILEVSAWDLWLSGAMMLAIGPAMHFAACGFMSCGEPAKADLRNVWEGMEIAYEDVAIEFPAADEEDFPIGLREEASADQLSD